MEIHKETGIMDVLKQLAARRASQQKMKQRQEDNNRDIEVERLPAHDGTKSIIEKLKKKKSPDELAKEVDVYEPITWNDTVEEDFEDKKAFKQKYRDMYDRIKNKQS